VCWVIVSAWQGTDNYMHSYMPISGSSVFNLTVAS